MLALAVSVLGGVLLCASLGRFDCAAAARTWRFLLSPAGAAAVAALTRDVETDALRLDYTYTRAVRARERAALREAHRLLGLALAVIEEAVPDRLTRLDAMRVVSRLAAAMLPLPPISPAGFRLTELRGIATLGAALHHLLVAGAERFRLRLWVLSCGFRVVLRCTRSACAGAPAAAAAWHRFETGMSDFKLLDREHADAFRAAVMALGAVERQTQAAVGSHGPWPGAS